MMLEVVVVVVVVMMMVVVVMPVLSFLANFFLQFVYTKS